MNTYQTYSKGPKAGQPKTLTDRVVRFLTEGLKMPEQSYNRSGKYRQFLGLKSNYWVGKSGAVRAGTSPSNSISMTAQVHVNMVSWERKNRWEKTFEKEQLK